MCRMTNCSRIHILCDFSIVLLSIVYCVFYCVYLTVLYCCFGVINDNSFKCETYPEVDRSNANVQGIKIVMKRRREL